MSKYVIDASVAIKWFLPEEDTAVAKKLMIGHELIVPQLLRAEIGNILWKRFQRSDITVEDARASLAALNTINLRWHEEKYVAQAALNIACQFGRSYYDSLYVALAVAENAVLVTADERLYNSLSGGPLASSITLLSNVT